MASLCVSSCLSLIKLALYVACCLYTSHNRVFQPLFDFNTTCQGPEMQANSSGVQVLVAAFAKMGTRSMSRALYELGLEHSYHGEEFILHVWSQHAADYWAGRGGPPALGLPWRQTRGDREVLEATRPEELARLVSRCRVDAVAFDGVEELFWPVQRVSPTAKVLVLDWRTFDQAVESMDNFYDLLVPYLHLLTLLQSSLSALPWPLLFHVAEPALGEPLRTFLRSGGPPVNQVQSVYVGLWLRAMGATRSSNHWFGGLSGWGRAEEEGLDVSGRRVFEGFFERVRQEIPPERRLHFDVRKDTYEDICRFLGLSPCLRSGRLPRARNLGNQEFDFPLQFLVHMLACLLLHLVNWRIFSGVLASAGACAMPTRRAKVA